MKVRTVHMKSNEMLDVCFKGKRVLLVAISDDQEEIQVGQVSLAMEYDSRDCTMRYLQSMLKK